MVSLRAITFFLCKSVESIPNLLVAGQFTINRLDRHRGSGCPLTPATPPCVRSVHGGSIGYANPPRPMMEARAI